MHYGTVTVLATVKSAVAGVGSGESLVSEPLLWKLHLDSNMPRDAGAIQCESLSMHVSGVHREHEQTCKCLSR